MEEEVEEKVRHRICPLRASEVYAKEGKPNEEHRGTLQDGQRAYPGLCPVLLQEPGCSTAGCGYPPFTSLWVVRSLHRDDRMGIPEPQPEEISSYNEVTNSGNAAAIKFAVEALSNRYHLKKLPVTGRSLLPQRLPEPRRASCYSDPRYIRPRLSAEWKPNWPALLIFSD